MSLISCSDSSKPTSFEFSLRYADKLVTCKESLSIDGEPWRLDQFQFFVYDFEVQSKQKWHSTEFYQTGAPSDLKSNRVRLIGRVCPSAGDWKVKISTDQNVEKIERIRFKLGVPFELNHLNPLTQPSPLNQPDMFWTWQLGHKFLRLEMSSENDSWIYHLGSTGCQSASAVRAPKKACKSPNIGKVEIAINAKENKPNQVNKIQLNLEQLISGIELGDKNSCQSEPDKISCQKLISRTGVGQASTIFSIVKNISD